MRGNMTGCREEYDRKNGVCDLIQDVCVSVREREGVC